MRIINIIKYILEEGGKHNFKKHYFSDFIFSYPSSTNST